MRTYFFELSTSTKRIHTILHCLQKVYEIKFVSKSNIPLCWVSIHPTKYTRNFFQFWRGFSQIEFSFTETLKISISNLFLKHLLNLGTLLLQAMINIRVTSRKISCMVFGTTTTNNFFRFKMQLFRPICFNLFFSIEKMFMSQHFSNLHRNRLNLLTNVNIANACQKYQISVFVKCCSKTFTRNQNALFMLIYLFSFLLFYAYPQSIGYVLITFT